jgi:SAM-dependent methyltransferase
MTRLTLTKEVVAYIAPLYVKGRTLDVGAGRAKYREIISKYASKYETCDIDPESGADYVADAQNLPFADSSYDTVLAFQVMEHVQKPSAVVSEMFRCLKSGGQCVITVPFLAPQHSHPSDYQRYTLAGLRELVESHGFEVVEAERFGGLPTVCAEFLKFLFLNPYGHRAYGKIRSAVVSRTIGALNCLDKILVIGRRDFYANVYVVARKP